MDVSFDFPRKFLWGTLFYQPESQSISHPAYFANNEHQTEELNVSYETMQSQFRYNELSTAKMIKLSMIKSAHSVLHSACIISVGSVAMK